MTQYKIDAQSGDITFPDGFVLVAPYDDERYLDYASWVQAGGQAEIINDGIEAELQPFKQAAAEQVVSEAETYGGQLTAGYPMHELLSWTTKAAEARAILDGADDPALYPVIAAECAFSKAAPRDVAEKIMGKALFFAQASGAVSGIRQAALAKIEAAKTKAGVEAALKWARGAADAALKGFKA